LEPAPRGARRDCYGELKKRPTRVARPSPAIQIHAATLSGALFLGDTTHPTATLLLKMNPRRVEHPKPKRRVYKPIRFGEGMQPGTAEWEMNRRRELKLNHQANDQLAELEATQGKRERRPRPWWSSLLRVFRGIWSEP